ncbi:hypothetical protein [Pseudomonas sp. DNDY-54]|uniref:hypothetical protein n=1 Tax=Pseudomonas sp. DNDY-54 TaxID=2870860 RepID=UPI001CA40CB5|nr:hypothetical protein [Pseudomonas sp. DNDY-54]
MDLRQKTSAELLEIYNNLAEKKAGPKTFASRAKLIERITKLAEPQGVDLTTFRQSEVVEVPDEHIEPQADRTETPEDQTETKKKRGRGVGELARLILMDPMGYPYKLIAAMVNAEISGATASSKSIAWYASKMRKAGIEVPERKKTFSADMDEKESAEWLQGVKVVSPV